MARSKKNSNGNSTVTVGLKPKDYARPALYTTRRGQLIDLLSNIKIGDEANRAKDVLGRVYGHLLSQFASSGRKKAGAFYLPCCVVKLLVEMLAPYGLRVYARAAARKPCWC